MHIKKCFCWDNKNYFTTEMFLFLQGIKLFKMKLLLQKPCPNLCITLYRQGSYTLSTLSIVAKFQLDYFFMQLHVKLKISKKKTMLKCSRWYYNCHHIRISIHWDMKVYTHWMLYVGDTAKNTAVSYLMAKAKNSGGTTATPCDTDKSFWWLNPNCL